MLCVLSGVPCHRAITAKDRSIPAVSKDVDTLTWLDGSPRPAMPQWGSSLHNNQAEVVSWYDLHLTLRHLLNPDHPPPTLPTLRPSSPLRPPSACMGISSKQIVLQAKGGIYLSEGLHPMFVTFSPRKSGK